MISPDTRVQIVVTELPRDCPANGEHPVNHYENCSLGRLFRDSGITESAATPSPSGPFAIKELTQVGFTVELNRGQELNIGEAKCNDCSLSMMVRRED
ncbi:hypothetical protein ACFL2C_03905 [Patescibacteria group bacterium]